MKEVAEIAGPHWGQLSPEQRVPYEERAKEEKLRAKTRPYAKLASSGIPLAAILEKERKNAQKVENQRMLVNKIIEYGERNKRLRLQPFYLLTFNYFIQDEKLNYFPCEMGVVKFSLKKGLTDKMNICIDAGQLPMGFAYTAISHSEKTHQLPLYPNALGTADYEEVLYSLTNFIGVEKTMVNDDNEFYLFVHEDEEKMVENILGQFCEKAEKNLEKYKILPLGYFFSQLRKKIEQVTNYKSMVPFTDTSASIYLLKDIFKYNKGNGCAFHEDPQINPHCAVSRVSRFAYTILHQCMDIANVKDRRSGFHFPTDVEPIVVEKPSKKQNQQQKNKGLNGETDTESCASSRTNSRRDAATTSETTLESHDWNDDTMSTISSTSTIKAKDFHHTNPFLLTAEEHQKPEIDRTRFNLFDQRKKTSEKDAENLLEKLLSGLTFNEE